MVKQNFYCLNNKMEIDTICNLIYKVKNESLNSLVVMFTEDDVSSLPLKMLIKRKILRKYGDFSISQFIWDNIDSQVESPLVPDFFVKILAPSESIDIILLLQNEDDCVVQSLFKNHLLICNMENIDNRGMFYGFKDAVDDHHLEYPTSSITMLWSRFYDWLQMRNSQSKKRMKQ